MIPVSRFGYRDEGHWAKDKVEGKTMLPGDKLVPAKEV